MADRFLLARFGLEVRAPTGWSDSQAEAALEKIEDKVEAHLHNLAEVIRKTLPEVEVKEDRL